MGRDCPTTLLVSLKTGFVSKLVPGLSRILVLKRRDFQSNGPGPECRDSRSCPARQLLGRSLIPVLKGSFIE